MTFEVPPSHDYQRIIFQINNLELISSFFFLTEGKRNCVKVWNIEFKTAATRFRKKGSLGIFETGSYVVSERSKVS